MIWFALTPAAAAVLADAFNLDLPFYLLAGLAVVTVLIMGRLESDEGALGTRTTNSLRLLRDRVVAGTLLLVTSQFVIIGAWEAVWAVSLIDLGAATWEVGLSFTVFAIPLGALAPVAGAWAQRTGGLQLCVGGLLGSAAAGVLLGMFDSVWSLVAVSMLMGIGAGLGYTAGLYAYSQTVTDDRQASSQGLMGAGRGAAGRGHVGAGGLALRHLGQEPGMDGDPGADGGDAGHRAAMARDAPRGIRPAAGRRLTGAGAGCQSKPSSIMAQPASRSLGVPLRMMATSSADAAA